MALRSLVCALAAAIIFTMQAGTISAQWKDPPADLAEHLWTKGYVFHIVGAYPEAIMLFRQSISIRPTAEGLTFLGWSLSHLGNIDEAISECKKAITIDPQFGNPYNDIGVYLTWQGRADEAIPWLRKAISAKRYCCYQFSHYTLGQILLDKGKILEARRLFERALEYDPNYLPAKNALNEISKSWL